MRETTEDDKLLKPLVCLERRQFDQIPAEYLQFKNKLSTRFGLVFYEDKICIPENLRMQIINLLHKGHPSINKMNDEADLFWWPKIRQDVQRKCEQCIPCKMSDKNIKPNIYSTERNQLPKLANPNEEIQLDYIGPNHRRPSENIHSTFH